MFSLKIRKLFKIDIKKSVIQRKYNLRASERKCMIIYDLCFTGVEC